MVKKQQSAANIHQIDAPIGSLPSVWPRMAIQDGERRVLFEPGDVDGVVSAIRDVPEKGDCWWHQAEMPRRFVETERSRRRRVGKHKRLYADAADCLGPGKADADGRNA